MSLIEWHDCRILGKLSLLLILVGQWYGLAIGLALCIGGAVFRY